jgi:hypothetical protein
MKIKNLAFVVLFLTVTTGLCAQDGGYQRRTVEERVKSVMEKIALFSLDKEKSNLADSAFTGYYKAVDTKREEMRASGSFDRDKMRAEMQKLGNERDDKLKTFFTADQFKKWKDEIEPSLRPQRPGGGGNQ